MAEERKLVTVLFAELVGAEGGSERVSVGGPGLDVRFGVNTGEAVAARPGTGPRIGEAVTGDVVNTASRLQGLAGPGEIVVGRETHVTLGAARCLLRLDRDQAEAERLLEEARVMLARLGARPLLDEIEALAGRGPARVG